MRIELVIDNCSLRSFRASDIPHLYHVLSDAETMRYIEPPFTPEQTASFVWREGLIPEPRIYAISDAEDACIGHVIFHPYDDFSYEIGWVISKSHRGHGLAKAATNTLLDEARRCGARRCVIEHVPEQRITAHIAQSLGFFAMEPKAGLRRWSFHLVRPDVIPICDGFRLRRFDRVYEPALAWYADPDTVYLVDGHRRPYELSNLRSMYTYLDAHGELYYIEAEKENAYVPIGDVTFWQEDMPIVIGDPRYRGLGLGRRVISSLLNRAHELGYNRVYVREIYDWNPASARCFESAGFRACEKTEHGSRYVCKL